MNRCQTITTVTTKKKRKKNYEKEILRFDH